ncbi:MAG: hypothetical protein Q7S16_01455 [bacterium]|nr:hypothetical protein [bacterium]
MKKGFAIFFLLLFVANIYGGVLLFPQRANAQGSVPTGEMLSIPARIIYFLQKQANKLDEIRKNALGKTISSALDKVVLNFAARLSSSIGSTLAEGGKGGSPLFDTKALNKAVNDAGEAARGEMIDAIGQGLGVNLCLPPDIRLGLSLQLGKAMEPPKPKCSYKEFKDKWKKFGDSFSDEEIFSKSFSLSLDPAQSEASQTANALLSADAAVAKAEHEKELERQYGKGWKGVEDPISGEVKTPPGILEEQSKEAHVQKLPLLQDPPELTGFIGTDVGLVAGYNFSIAFLQGGIKRLIAGLFKPQPPIPSRRGGGALGSLGSGSSGGAKAPDVQGVSFSSTGSEFDLLSEFTTCPDVGASIYNCVVDQNFAQAIRDGMTIREAVKDNFDRRLDGTLLNVTLPFGKGGSSADQTLRYDSGYALHNLKKLRRARIIPVGWELAAQIIEAEAKVGKGSKTLGDVLNGFNDATSSFYHLVDPDWLLKAPLYYCKMTAPGQLLAAPGSEDRMEYCVDLQDCVAPTADGNGCQSWGYCTRERNTWRFDAKQCDAQFNTCLSYKQEDNGQAISYNRNTVTSCNQNEVGCRWFALSNNATLGVGSTPSVTPVQWNANPRRYFNRTVAECSAQANGCTEFVRLTNKATGRPLSVAEYVTAKDVATGASVSTSSSSAAAAVAATKNYEDFSAEPNATFNTKRLTIKYLDQTLNDCRGPRTNASLNVGCERFTSASGVDPAVPAVLDQSDTSKDTCPNTCVGYDAYEEVKTPFSSGKFPEYFIPSSARTCSTDVVGCEEFTNLDAVGQQGEAREYFTALRQCQKPATDSRTYYTWVGTEKTGYQLETYSLKASNLDGGKAPCTTRDTQNGNVCNEVVGVDAVTNLPVDTREQCAKADLLTNPDCREFYDKDGNISYRLYSKTIVSSDTCIRYRMTNSEGAENCKNTGGEWSGTSCVYLVLPQESRSCSASAVGCREYKGNTANDIRVVVNEGFESTKNAQGEVVPPAAWTTGKISQASLTQNGHSFETDGGRVAVELKKKVNGVDVPDVSENRTYILSFWSKSLGGNIDVDPVLTNGSGKEARFGNTSDQRLRLTADWQKYTLGPVFVTWRPDAAVRLEINGDSFVIDNFVLQEVRDDFYLIKNSWTTDPICEHKVPGDISTARTGEDRMIGCRAYTDRAKNPYAVKAFHQLCEEKFVGCEALINTQNTTKPDAQISAYDDIAYVVNDPKNYCAQSEKGCRAMSAPQVAEIGATFEADTVYKIDDPEKYTADPEGKGSILCTAQNLACEAYTKSDGGHAWFIDPYANVTKTTGKPTTCEWKLFPETLTQQFGWFKKGSSSLTPDCVNPPFDGSAGFVKECPAEADRCSQFVDPQDLSRSASRLILNESFEGTAPSSGWSVESFEDEDEIIKDKTVINIENGGIIQQKALSVSGANGFDPYTFFILGTEVRVGPIRVGGTYRLSFWAKGNGGTLVTWFGGAPGVNGYFLKKVGDLASWSIPVTGNWTYHRLTRVATVGESGASQDLRFEGGNGLTGVFLDGVQLEAITDVKDTGRPFYMIDDETVKKKRSDGVQASVADQKAGYVLFQNANQGAEKWDSALSYQAKKPVACTSGQNVCIGGGKDINGKVYDSGSDTAACTTGRGKVVGCIGNDTNDLLKVQRDRVCGEWLSCVSGTQVFDKQTQKPRDICYAVGACTEPSASNAAACGKMKDVDADPQLLDVTLYKTRDLTWKGQEYAGYSIPYRYPVMSLTQLPYKIDSDTKVPEGYRLHNLALKRVNGKEVACTVGTKNEICGSGPTDLCLYRGKTLEDIDSGFCYEDKKSGRAFTWNATTKSSDVVGEPLREIAKSCRAYPATDAPFPPSVATWQQGFRVSKVVGDKDVGEIISDPEFQKPITKEEAYRAANVVQQQSAACTLGAQLCVGGVNDHKVYAQGVATTLCTNPGPNLIAGTLTPCEDRLLYMHGDGECSYNEVRYKDGETRYWGVTGNYPKAVPTGTTNTEDAIQVKYGWQGYCLETDSASPTPIENADGRKEACLTWFPTDLVQGEIDVNADSPEAGFKFLSDSSKFYCVATQVYVHRKEYSYTQCETGGTCPAGYILRSDGKVGQCSRSRGSRRAKRQYTCTPAGGSGWFPDDPSISHDANPPRTICSKIVLVEEPVTRKTYGWTERLMGPAADTDRTKPRMSTIPDFVSYGEAQAPYGATLGLSGADAFFIPGIPWDDGNAGPLPTTPKIAGIVGHGGKPYAGDDIDDTRGSVYKSGVVKVSNIFARTFGVLEYSPKVVCNGSVKMCTNSSGTFGPKEGARCDDASECKTTDPAAIKCLSFCELADIDLLETKAALGSWQAVIDKIKAIDSEAGGKAQDKYNILNMPSITVNSFGNIISSEPSPWSLKSESERAEILQAVIDPSSQRDSCTRKAMICQDPNNIRNPINGENCTLNPNVCTTEKVCKYSLLPSDANFSQTTADSINNTNCTTDSSVCGATATCELVVGATCVPATSCYNKNNPNDPVNDSKCTTDAICQDVTSECTKPAACFKSGGEAGYYLLESDFPTIEEISGDVTDNGKAPKVRAAEYTATNQTYAEGGSGITVDTNSSGDYMFTATAQAVTVKFYAYNANGQQMPLRRVLVDWSDGSDLSATQGSLKNRKNVCQRFCGTATVKNAAGVAIPKHCNKNEDCGTNDSCGVTNWGDDVNACVEDAPGGGSGYFTYTHIYRCEGPVSAGWQDDVDPLVLGNQGACVFVPRVQVLDNWGWCNGTCTNASGVAQGGCYNDPKGTRLCESTTPTSKAWTSYVGRVILKPQ